VGSIIFRDEEEIFEKLNMPLEQALKEIVMPYKAQLEKWYLDNLNLGLYAKIIFITAWVVVFPNSNLHKKWLKNLPVNKQIENIKNQ
jgi:lipopolysaccharide/colanic/teichoic acid biosynthesis glycosyltransferase